MGDFTQFCIDLSLNEAMSTDNDAFAIDPARHAISGQFAYIGRQYKIYTAPLSGQYKSLRHRMFGHLVKGGGETQ